MKRLSFFFYGFLIFTGIGICWLSLQMGYGEAARPGSGFLPFWFGLLMALISLGIVIQGYRQKKDKLAAGNKRTPQAIDPRKPLVILGAMVLYGLCLYPLGSVLANMIFLLLILQLVWPKGWKFNLVAMLLINSAFYVVFQILMEVRLPLGLIPEMLFR